MHVITEKTCKSVPYTIIMNGITLQQSTAVYSYSNGKDFLSLSCYANVTRSYAFHITLFTISPKSLTKRINMATILKIRGT